MSPPMVTKQGTRTKNDADSEELKSGDVSPQSDAPAIVDVETFKSITEPYLKRIEMGGNLQNACARVAAINAVTETERFLGAVIQLQGREGLFVLYEELLESYKEDKIPKSKTSMANLLMQMSGDPARTAWVDNWQRQRCQTGYPVDFTRSSFVEGRIDGHDDKYDCITGKGGTWALLKQVAMCAQPTAGCCKKETRTVSESGNGAEKEEITTYKIVAPVKSRNVIAYVPNTGPIISKFVKWPDDIDSVIPSLVYDFDNDGFEEGVWTGSFYNEGETTRWIRIFTVAGQEVREYSINVPGNLEEVKDMTGDGIPDLLMHTWVLDEECDSGFGDETRTVTFLAEGDGKGAFSLTTPAAVQHLKQQCPKKPNIFKTAVDVACGKIWGMSRKQLRDAIKAGNDRWDCNADYAYDDNVRKPNRANYHFPSMMAAAGLTYPVMIDQEGQLHSR